jgi:hypothetical protein
MLKVILTYLTSGKESDKPFQRRKSYPKDFEGRRERRFVRRVRGVAGSGR